MATVDIIMATYNGERYVREQIESIQAQTFEDWRLLVSDDCSTDNTLVVVEDMASEDSRIAIASSKVSFGSAKANFIHLLSATDAPYAMFCDQDDVWLPSKVQACVSRIRTMESSYSSEVPLLVFSDMKVVDKDLDVMQDSFERSSNFDPTRLELRYLLALNVAAGCSMLFNRALIKAATVNQDLSKTKMHDWWLMLVASAFGHISYIDESLNLYRQHGHNSVGANDYSAVKRAKDESFMMREFRSTLDQAQAFLTAFEGRLSSDASRRIIHYAAIGESNSFLIGLWHLFASGCWKKGARKLGQIEMVRRLTAANR